MAKEAAGSQRTATRAGSKRTGGALNADCGLLKMSYTSMMQFSEPKLLGIRAGHSGSSRQWPSTRNRYS